ncbi:sodium:solute symporter family transporter [Geoglobus acetivorans]|uniref:Proline/sodium symporter PutP n=1 Tax=Geoglobus acetivorans TaxID=565033 RepID=A0A0A7GFH7_GEOAI|nr:Proline/sodium symporter PutP [Geoglobus acetivorans]
MIIAAVFTVYLILMLIIGAAEYRKSRGLLDYYLAGKGLGVTLVSFSFFATYFSTSAFLGGGGFGFVAGFQWSAFLTFFHVLFAILAWLLIAPKLKQLAEETSSLTIPEIFGSKFGKEVQMLSSAVIIVFFSFYMVSIYKGAGNLLQVMLDIPYTHGLIITALIVVLYTSIGGFRAVVYTDLIQGLLTFTGGIVLFASIIYFLGGFEVMEKLAGTQIFAGKGALLFEVGKLAPPPIMKAGMVIPFILSLTFAISIAQLSSPQLVIRFVAAKNEDVLKKGALLTPLIIGVFAICVFSIGPLGWLIIPQFDDPVKYLKDSDLVVPVIAMKVLPEGINALLLTAIIAAAMSTVNSLLHMMATSLTKDILNRENIALTRTMVFVLSLIPLYIALKPPEIIVGIVGVSFSVITSVFLVPLLAMLYAKPSRYSILASMVVALIASVVWYFMYYRVYWIYPVVPGLIASALTYMIFEKFFK